MGSRNRDNDCCERLECYGILIAQSRGRIGDSGRLFCLGSQGLQGTVAVEFFGGSDAK